jgi:hypothetical protein
LDSYYINNESSTKSNTYGVSDGNKIIEIKKKVLDEEAADSIAINGVDLP